MLRDSRTKPTISREQAILALVRVLAGQQQTVPLLVKSPQAAIGKPDQPGRGFLTPCLQMGTQLCSLCQQRLARTQQIPILFLLNGPTATDIYDQSRQGSDVGLVFG